MPDSPDQAYEHRCRGTADLALHIGLSDAPPAKLFQATTEDHHEEERDEHVPRPDRERDREIRFHQGSHARRDEGKDNRQSERNQVPPPPNAPTQQPPVKLGKRRLRRGRHHRAVRPDGRPEAADM